jgi:hypothetical protein
MIVLSTVEIAHFLKWFALSPSVQLAPPGPGARGNCSSRRSCSRSVAQRRARRFSFLSRPLGKGLFYIFVAIYFMGASWSPVQVKNVWSSASLGVGEKELEEASFPFLAGFGLMLVGCVYVVLFAAPCLPGGCCCDQADPNYEAKQARRRPADLPPIFRSAAAAAPRPHVPEPRAGGRAGAEGRPTAGGQPADPGDAAAAVEGDRAGRRRSRERIRRH